MECNFAEAVPFISKEHYRQRKNNLKMDLYRAIFRGDLDAAEDAANLMAMVDIDRDEIEGARREIRR